MYIGSDGIPVYSESETNKPTLVSSSNIASSFSSTASSLLSSASSLTSTKANVDRRVRLRAKPGAENYVYGSTSGIMNVLRNTNGMVWMTTPTISESHSVKYSSYEPAHGIVKFNNFEHTDNVILQITGDFFVNNATEATYLLAVITFLRTSTMVDFGKNATQAGTPPPILLFSGYGSLMYNDISVIIKNVNFTLQNDVDYIQVPVNSGTQQTVSSLLKSISNYYTKSSNQQDRVWVPSKLSISLTLEEQPTAQWTTDTFDLAAFKNGTLLTGGGFL